MTRRILSLAWDVVSMALCIAAGWTTGVVIVNGSAPRATFLWSFLAVIACELVIAAGRFAWQFYSYWSQEELS